MDQFVSALLAVPPLTAEHERALARRARGGDRAAREALITAGMRSVVLRARMRGFRGHQFDDAVQAGAVGLIKAVDRFDPDRGVRLATYAWRWVGGEMPYEVRPDVPLDDVDRASDTATPSADGLLDGLPADLADVLRLRFGLGPGAPAPLSRRAAGEALGLTEAQVRTIESKAMRQLRSRLAKVVDRAPPPRGAGPP